MENEEFEFSREDYKKMFEKTLENLAQMEILKDLFKQKMIFKSGVVNRLEKENIELRAEIEALRNQKGESK